MKKTCVVKQWVLSGLALLFGALVGIPSPVAAELKVGLGGFVLLDVQQGDKVFGGAPIPNVANTPLDTDKEKNHRETVVDARQTRLRATFSETETVTGLNFSGLVETDFFNSDGDARTSNTRRLQLRHGFARTDHPSGFFLLAGQWWSLFSNIVSVPPPANFTAQAGRLVARQPQLKVGYKTPLEREMGNLLFEVDVEKHSLDNLGSTSVDESQGGGQDIPLGVGKLSWFHSIFEVEAAGAVGSNRVIPVGGNDDREMAWGGQVSAGVKIGPVRLFGHYHFLDGLQRLAGGRFPSAFLVQNRVENVESDGWNAGLTYNLTKDTSFNAVYGWDKADEIRTAGFTGTRLERHQSLQVNVLHKFWTRWQAGLEYRRFDVETFNGRDGDVNFVHGALWFFF